MSDIANEGVKKKYGIAMNRPASAGRAAASANTQSGSTGAASQAPVVVRPKKDEEITVRPKKEQPIYVRPNVKTKTVKLEAHKDGGKACGGKMSKYADGGKVEDARIAARMAAGNYKKGGKVQTSADTARKLATEMGGMKKGGAKKAPKDGLAVMIAIGKPMKPEKKAVGGAGKTRKGMAPIKKAQGGAAKVRKGMMTPEGNIINVMNKMRGK